MGKTYPAIDARIRAFIAAQQMFFVATAPRDESAHLNISPKGLDTFRVLDDHTIGYLDYVGSGAETIAHLRENGRVVIMFCAFQGPPNIVRLHGRGDVVEPQDAEYAALRPLFPPGAGSRAIIRVRVDRIADTCGFGVPLYSYEGQRTQLTDWAERKGEPALMEYQEKKNAESIDGLPALRWVKGTRAG
jgi:predicted pyridoxine 5'-phosphate oxidase superfamily flavin-nucleotide-binding protein